MDKFIEKLNNTNNLFDRIELLYDFAENSNSLIEDLSILINSYNNLFQDVNEIKTLLILTNSFKDNPLLKENREKLVKRFNDLMS